MKTGKGEPRGFEGGSRAAWDDEILEGYDLRSQSGSLNFLLPSLFTQGTGFQSHMLIFCLSPAPSFLLLLPPRTAVSRIPLGLLGSGFRPGLFWQGVRHCTQKRQQFFSSVGHLFEQ